MVGSFPQDRRCHPRVSAVRSESLPKMQIMNDHFCRILLFFSAVIFGVSTVSSAAETRPNILLIVADNQGAWTLGCYGNREIRTPKIDRLAQEGMLFTRCFSSNSVCSPTRATLLTGLMPSQHGVHCWLAGGPSHLDTFDPKPEAGNDYCGPLNQPIQTNVDGIRIGHLDSREAPPPPPTGCIFENPGKRTPCSVSIQGSPNRSQNTCWPRPENETHSLRMKTAPESMFGSWSARPSRSWVVPPVVRPLPGRQNRRKPETGPKQAPEHRPGPRDAKSGPVDHPVSLGMPGDASNGAPAVLEVESEVPLITAFSAVPGAGRPVQASAGPASRGMGPGDRCRRRSPTSCRPCR